MKYFQLHTTYYTLGNYSIYLDEVYENTELLEKLKKSIYDTPLDTSIVNNLSNNIAPVKITQNHLEIDDINTLVLLAYNKYELDKLVYSVYPEVRNAVALNGYGLPLLKILQEDKDWRVRGEALKTGMKYVEMALDPNQYIRAGAAREGIKLEMLINDQSSIVRYEVARQGYGLNRLINDPNYMVLYPIIDREYQLDKVIKKDIEHINLYMVGKGLMLDTLIYNHNPKVRKVAFKKASLLLKIKSILNIKKYINILFR